MKHRIPLASILASSAAVFAFTANRAGATLSAYDGFGVASPTTVNAPYAAPANTSVGGGNNIGSLLNGRPAIAVTGFGAAWSEIQLPLNVSFTRYHGVWAQNYPGLLSNNTAGALVYGSDFAYPEINDVNRATRLLSSPITASTVGTRYISFLVRKNNVSNGYIGFEMLNGSSATNTTRVLQVGGSSDTSGSTGNWGMRVGNTAQKNSAAIGTAAQTNVPVVENRTALVVLKLDLSASPASDSITMWVNPSDLATEAGSGAGVTISGIDFAADRIALASYTFAGHWFFFDEFRLGTAWASVLPSPSVETAAPVGVPNQATLGAVSSPFSYTVFASNRPTQFSFTGTLPAGLTFDTAYGIISGTPTAVADTTINVQATNVAGTSVAFPVAIKIVSALNVRELVVGTTTGRGDTAILSSDPVNVSPEPSAANSRDGSLTTFHASDNFYNNRLVVDLGSGSEKYLTGFRFFPRPSHAGRAFAGEVQTSIDGNNWVKLGDIDFVPTAGAWNSVAITSTALGRYLRYYHPGRADIAEIEFRTFGDIPAPPVIPAQSFTMTTGENIRFTLQASNEPHTSWQDASSMVDNNRLPAGLSLNTVTGEISGSTSEVGVFTPSFIVTNADGPSAAQVVTINMIAPALIVYEGFEYNADFTGASLALSPAVMAAAPVGTVFTNQILAADGSEYFVGNGGTGWTNTWKSFSQEPITAPSLAKNNLLTAGNKAGIGTNGNNRQFPLQYQTGTYWVNLLMSVQDTTPPSDIAFNVNLTAPDNSTQVGIAFNFLKYRVGGNSVPNLDLSTVAKPVLADGTVHMITVRLNMFTGLMHAWVNATPGSVAPADSEAVDPAGTAFTPFAFNGIALGGFNNTPTVPRFVDEIRIGKTFAQVAPSASVPSALDTFRTANGLPADGSGDLLTPANDGVANLLKYAFNMIGSSTGQAANLSTPNSAQLVVSTGVAGLPAAGVNGSNRLTITFIRPKASVDSGVLTTVEFSSALEANNWAVNASATEVVTSVDAIYERVTVTDSVTSGPRRFVRVKVQAEN